MHKHTAHKQQGEAQHGNKPTALWRCDAVQPEAAAYIEEMYHHAISIT
ncbi:MAG: hypothetical protein SOU82_04855 [Alloprevotella sp.]|nr:hypothetical protein [Alloprevotella sp.]MDY2779164.1 hypothetical protein [Alloprevotella sp.]MDY4058665.1 hypothetical protein [Alloprevotella sp.]